MFNKKMKKITKQIKEYSCNQELDLYYKTIKWTLQNRKLQYLKLKTHGMSLARDWSQQMKRISDLEVIPIKYIQNETQEERGMKKISHEDTWEMLKQQNVQCFRMREREFRGNGQAFSKIKERHQSTDSKRSSNLKEDKHIDNHTQSHDYQTSKIKDINKILEASRKIKKNKLNSKKQK